MPDPLDTTLTRPTHYGGEENPFEPIKIIEHYDLGFCLGNAIKYILRAGAKAGEPPEKDLAKAGWFVGRAIKQLQPQEDAGGLERLADLFDEDSYYQGMQDASASPSAVMRAIIYSLQESGHVERFVAESDLEVAPTKAVEIERVKLNGEPGFMVKVVEYSPYGPPIHSGDPGDEHVDKQGWAAAELRLAEEESSRSVSSLLGCGPDCEGIDTNPPT